jgi:hypothetical protein
MDAGHQSCMHGTVLDARTRTHTRVHWGRFPGVAQLHPHGPQVLALLSCSCALRDVPVLQVHMAGLEPRRLQGVAQLHPHGPAKLRHDM